MEKQEKQLVVGLAVPSTQAIPVKDYGLQHVKHGKRLDDIEKRLENIEKLLLEIQKMLAETGGTRTDDNPK